MRVLIATDAASPQVNGVVRTYERMAAEAAALRVDVEFIGPNHFPTTSMPLYPEIELALPSARKLSKFIENSGADYIHIATEGPIGWMTRSACRRQRRAFTTSYHTRFPEYVFELAGIPPSAVYPLLRHFHNASAGTMVATPSLASELARHGFRHLMPWMRGVDADLFSPRDVRLFGSARPVFLYVGRVSKEKNLEAFLDCRLDGTKVVVGDGPHLPYLRSRYSDVLFTGRKSRSDLADCYASADVFVFPSRTDTFGLVLLEAMACGLPVAAYPVTGPIDNVVPGVTGMLDPDLERAARSALQLDRRQVRSHAQQFTWRRTAEMFFNNIVVANDRRLPESSPNTETGRRNVVPARGATGTSLLRPDARS